MLKKILKKILNIYFWPQTIGEKESLSNKKFIIISNNCWGYELYQTLGRSYNTPFVGIFLFPNCYLKFLDNFPNSLEWSLTFTKKSKYVNYTINYPIGLLNNDIEIHFMHYKTNAEALEKWQRRIARMKNSLNEGTELFVKLCDSDGCTKDHLQEFHNLRFKNKISISINDFNNKNHLFVPNLINKKKTSVTNGLKLYKYRYKYFDLCEWIKTGKIKKNFVSKIKSKLC